MEAIEKELHEMERLDSTKGWRQLSNIDDINNAVIRIRERSEDEELIEDIDSVLRYMIDILNHVKQLGVF